MVQIIDRIPGRGEKLAGAVGDITQTLTGHFAQQHAAKQENEAFKRMGIDVEGMSPEMKKIVVSEMLKGRGAGTQGAMQEMQIKNRAQQAFNSAVDALKGGHLGRTSTARGFFFGDTAKDIGRFQTAMAPLEAALSHMLNVPITDTKFKYITEQILPKPTDSEEMIEGKLEKLAEQLDLDPSKLKGAIKNISPQGDWFEKGGKQRPSLSSFGG